jgi:hypothetical protein
MTPHKPRSTEREELPIFSKVDQIVTAYFSMWEKQFHTLNEVWADSTAPDATLADLPRGWAKLLQNWTDSAQDLCGAIGVHGNGSSEGSPLVTFVIDQSAEADAGPQTVPLPAGVDPNQIVAAPLVSIEAAGANQTYSGGNGPSVIALLVDGRIEIRVAFPRQPKFLGRFLSVVYESKSGVPGTVLNPPPRPVIANVLVLFLDSPL